MEELNCWVVRVENSGLGILVDEQENEYPFTMDKLVRPLVSRILLEGYHGESLKSIGLNKGVKDACFCLLNGNVSAVSLKVDPARKRKKLSLDFSMLWQKNGRVARVH